MKVLKASLSAALGTKSESPPYIYSIVPHNASTLAAISSDDTLRAFTADGLKIVTEGKHAGVQCLSIGPGERRGEGHVLLTAGRDACVKLWDGRVEGGKVVVGGAGQARVPITSMCSSSEGHIFATGMEQAHSVAAVAVWDIRKSAMPIVNYAECHNDDVTELSFSSHSAAHLLSGSTDGLVNIFDTTVHDEDEALLQIVNQGASIHHAGFISSLCQNSSAKPSDALVYALSHNETLSLYHRSDSTSDGQSEQERELSQDDTTVIFGDLRPRLGCEYAVDVLPLGTAVVLAAGNHNEQLLDLIPLAPSPEWNFAPADIVRLVGAHEEEIVRTVYIAEQSNVIYTGGEDGLVKVWKPDESLASQSEVVAEEKSGPPSKSKKKAAKHHRPY